MRTKLFWLTAVIVLGLSASSSADHVASKNKRRVLAEHCGHEHVYCLSVDVVKKQVKLTLVTLAPEEYRQLPYRLCVRPPHHRRECRRFVARRKQDVLFRQSGRFQGEFLASEYGPLLDQLALRRPFVAQAFAVFVSPIGSLQCSMGVLGELRA